MLEADRIVGRRQRVAVGESQFKLTGGIFGDRRAGGDAHHVARGPQVAEEAVGPIELGDAVDLAVRRAAAVGSGGDLDATVGGARRVDQVEFELARDDRGQAVGREARENALQDGARVERARATVELVHAE